MLTERDLTAAGVSAEELLRRAREAPAAPGAPSAEEVNERLADGVGPMAIEGYVKRLFELRDARTGLPITSHRPGVGRAVVAAKQAFRSAFQPFLNEALRKQAEFNETLAQWAQAVTRAVVRQEAEAEAFREQVEGRLRALEQARAEGERRRGG